MPTEAGDAAAITEGNEKCDEATRLTLFPAEMNQVAVAAELRGGNRAALPDENPEGPAVAVGGGSEG